MKAERIRGEVADLEWIRASSIGWPVLSIICVVQAILFGSGESIWKIYFSIGAILSIFISWVTKRIWNWKYSQIPTIAYLLITPIALHDVSESPWISLGLLTFAAVIYFSMFENAIVASIIVIGLALFQSWAANQNFPSFTDSKDLSLLYSYFSFTWTIVIGLASILIRRRYLHVAANLEETIDFEMQENGRKLLELKQINQKDSRNVRLHGTILNSLIYLRQKIQLREPIADVLSHIKDEVNELRASESSARIEDLLNEMISRRLFQRIQVTISNDIAKKIPGNLSEGVLEVIREFILNLEKHSKATSVAIDFAVIDSGVRITLYDNSLFKEKITSFRRTLRSPKMSKTLNSILFSYGAEISFRVKFPSMIRKTTIFLPNLEIESELVKSFARARIAGLNDFVLNFVRAGMFYLVIALPGYFFIGLSWSSLLLLILMSFTLMLFLQRAESLFLYFANVILYSAIIPVVSYESEHCSSISALPWIFNHVLTFGFFSAVTMRNQFLKWLPIAILLLQTLALPLNYPASCQSIFLGSIPGIPLIIILAHVVVGIRRREIRFNNDEASRIIQLSSIRTLADREREESLISIIDEIENFIGCADNLSEKDIGTEVTLGIEKIQNFLVCSEYFDSPLISEIYKIYAQRLANGQGGKISIAGQVLPSLEEGLDIAEIGQFLLGELNSGGRDISILYLDTLEIAISGYKHHMKSEDETLSIGTITVKRLP